MGGTTAPLPNTPLCRGAQLRKGQGHLYLYFDMNHNYYFHEPTNGVLRIAVGYTKLLHMWESLDIHL